MPLCGSSIWSNRRRDSREVARAGRGEEAVKEAEEARRERRFLGGGAREKKDDDGAERGRGEAKARPACVWILTC